MLPGQAFQDASFYRSRRPALTALVSSEAALVAHAYWVRDDVPFFIPADSAVDTSVHAVAVVNHARWVVNCPFCPSAQLASRTDMRFFCVSCLNEQAGARWVNVVWPANVAAIEAALRPRQTENANWAPPETVADLIAENQAHGL